MKLLALNTKVKRTAQNLNATDKTHLAKKRQTTNNHGLKRFNWQRIHSTNLTTKCDQAIYKHLSHQDKENAPEKLATMLEPVSDSLAANTSNVVPPESS